jgi:NADH-quinone oxidoreductase subunit A
MFTTSVIPVQAGAYPALGKKPFNTIRRNKAMSAAPPINVALTPIIFYFLGVILIVGLMIAMSWVLGQKRRERATGQPFESGIVPAANSSAQLRFSVHFYLIGIFFVIFDLEAVFIFAWAIAFRESGWPGFIEIFIFITVLAAGLAYLWLVGALDWRTETQKKQLALRWREDS